MCNKEPMSVQDRAVCLSNSPYWHCQYQYGSLLFSMVLRGNCVCFAGPAENYGSTIKYRTIVGSRIGRKFHFAYFLLFSCFIYRHLAPY